MVVLFWLVTPSWLNPRTIPAIISQNTPLALVAMAMTFSIISRHIDLSTGSVLALSGVVCGIVFRETGSLALALPAAFVVSIGVSLFNGLLVARLGLSAIMVTLAAYIWARGLALALTKGTPIEVSGAWADLMGTTVAGFSITAPIIVVAYVVGWLLLTRTKMGRYTYAMGGDPAAARRARIDVPRYTLLIFVLMGIMVGLGSIVVVGQLASAQPYVAAGLVPRRDHRGDHRRDAADGRRGEPRTDRARCRVHRDPQQRPAQPRSDRRVLPGLQGRDPARRAGGPDLAATARRDVERRGMEREAMGLTEATT